MIPWVRGRDLHCSGDGDYPYEGVPQESLLLIRESAQTIATFIVVRVAGHVETELSRTV